MAIIESLATGTTPGTNWGVDYPVNVPAGTVDGDLLVAVNVSEWNTIANNAVPAGFTRLTTSEFDGGANGMHISIGYRIAASEPASYTFGSGDGSANAGAIFRLSGHDPAAVFAQAAGVAGLAAPSIVPNGTDDLMMTFHASRTGGSNTMTWTPPTGMTEHVDLTGGNYVSLHAASLDSPSNPSGTKTATPSFGEETCSASISIKSEEIVVPTGGGAKVWDGTSWVSRPVKVWDGSAWVEAPIKVWDGSSWVLSNS